MKVVAALLALIGSTAAFAPAAKEVRLLINDE